MEKHYTDIFRLLSVGEYPAEYTKTQRFRLKKTAGMFTLKDGQLFLGKRKVVKTLEDARDIFQEFHASPLGGHAGFPKTQSTISLRFFWKGMTVDIRNWIQECERCQMVRKPLSVPQPLQCMKVSQVWELVGIDLAGPFHETANEFQYIMTVTDYFSKWVEAFPLKTKSAAEVGRNICTLICRHGCPTRILSDEGREFVKALNDRMCEVLRIKKSVIAVYHQQTNRLDDKTNHTIKRALEKLVNDRQDDWDLCLDFALFSIRSQMNTTTKHSPFLLMYGREAVFPSQLAVELPPAFPPERKEMVRSCSAANCVNRQTAQTKRKGITFHRFPKKEPRRTQWINAVSRSHAAVGSFWNSSVHSSLCSQHFHDKQFDRTGQTVRLRDSAVPVIFSTLNARKMPRHCSALCCTTRDSRQTRAHNISFHRLPRNDDPRRSLWIANCRRRDPSGTGIWNPSSDYVYFCSKHFEKSCFEVVGLSGYHRLKEDAVPTIFTQLTKLRKSANLKAQKKKNSKVIKTRVKRKRDCLGNDDAAPRESANTSNNQCFDSGKYDNVPTPDMDNFHGLCAETIDIPGDAAPSEGALATTVDHQMHPEATLEGIEVPSVMNGPLSDLVLSHVREKMTSKMPLNTEKCEPPKEVNKAPQPVSPSTYMMRIPKPPGAYIENEHSYHVGNAVLWKRRAEAALEALRKVQRQLEACRRREQRLRLRISSLQHEHMRERRAQSDVREKLKEHLQVFELQLINDFV